MGEREAQEGGDVCIYIYNYIYNYIYIYIYMKPVFTQCFTAEINTTLQSNYPPIKKKTHTNALFLKSTHP